MPMYVKNGHALKVFDKNKKYMHFLKDERGTCRDATTPLRRNDGKNIEEGDGGIRNITELVGGDEATEEDKRKAPE